MEELELKLKTIKSDDKRNIDIFLDDTASEFSLIDGLENELHMFLEKNGLNTTEEKQAFFAVILLSCILGDIGTQMSPYIRNQNIAKIKEIAQRRNINYNYLVRFTSYSDSMIGIINTYLVKH